MRSYDLDRDFDNHDLNDKLRWVFFLAIDTWPTDENADNGGCR